MEHLLHFSMIFFPTKKCIQNSCSNCNTDWNLFVSLSACKIIKAKAMQPWENSRQRFVPFAVFRQSNQNKAAAIQLGALYPPGFIKQHNTAQHSEGTFDHSINLKHFSFKKHYVYKHTHHHLPIDYKLWNYQTNTYSYAWLRLVFNSKWWPTTKKESLSWNLRDTQQSASLWNQNDIMSFSCSPGLGQLLLHCDKNTIRPEASQHSSATIWGINPLFFFFFTDFLKEDLKFNAASDNGCSLHMVDGVKPQIREGEMKRREARDGKWRVPLFGGFTDGYSTYGAQLVLSVSRASQRNIYYVNKSSDRRIMTREGSFLLKFQFFLVFSRVKKRVSKD